MSCAKQGMASLEDSMNKQERRRAGRHQEAHHGAWGTWTDGACTALPAAATGCTHCSAAPVANCAAKSAATRLDLETIAPTPASALSALLLASSFFTGGAAAAAPAPGTWLMLLGPLPRLLGAAAGGAAAAAASAAASSSVLPPRTCCCSEEPEAEPWDSRLCPLSARLDSSSDSSAASCWRGEVEGGGGAAVAVAADAMSPIPQRLPRV